MDTAQSQQVAQLCALLSTHLDHRMMWAVKDLKIMLFQPSATGRDATKMLRVLSYLALNISRDVSLHSFFLTRG